MRILTPIESIQNCMLMYTTMCYKSQKKAAKHDAMRHNYYTKANYSFLRGFDLSGLSVKIGSLFKKEQSPRRWQAYSERLKSISIELIVAYFLCCIKFCVPFCLENLEDYA